MDKFEKLSGIAAPMPLINIDTDMIIPKVFLKTIKRSGLGVNLFDEMRYDDDRSEKPDFVLNKPQYRNAEILVAGDNFGCGSSREHAPWALEDYGFRAIIAPSFADIFYNNCFKNGLLPIVLSSEIVDHLFSYSGRININLEEQTVKTDQDSFEFEVDSERKRRLVNGLDDIGLTLQNENQIRLFETEHFEKYPWL